LVTANWIAPAPPYKTGWQAGAQHLTQDAHYHRWCKMLTNHNPIKEKPPKCLQNHWTKWKQHLKLYLPQILSDEFCSKYVQSYELKYYMYIKVYVSNFQNISECIFVGKGRQSPCSTKHSFRCWFGGGLPRTILQMYIWNRGSTDYTYIKGSEQCK
jgi:hypothetical protein